MMKSAIWLPRHCIRQRIIHVKVQTRTVCTLLREEVTDKADTLTTIRAMSGGLVE
jgi:hypothetical protein